MCLIVDANCASLLANANAEAAPVANWLRTSAGKLAIGGSKLAEEYKKLEKFMKLLAVLDSLGKLSKIPPSIVDNHQEEIQQSLSLQSDDPHILALARASGSRVVFSKDIALHQDFGNLTVLNPKGKVYQDASHAHLLYSAPKCVKT